MMEAVNDWLERVTLSSLNVPHPAEIDPHKEIPDATSHGGTAANSGNIVPFRILIKSLEILPSHVSSSLVAPYEVQFCATLFDGLYKRFYGQTWLSPWHKGKLAADNLVRVGFTEPLYCHLPLTNDQNSLVIQFVFRSSEEKEDRDELVGGWTQIKLKPWTDADDITKAISNRQALYYGSPRALMFLNQPPETSDRVLKVPSAVLFVDIKYHEPLFSVIQYLPEYTIFGRGTIIGGIQFSNDPDDDALKQPVLQANRKNILIEHVEIDLEPSVNAFEDELCRLISKDRLDKKERAPTTLTALVNDPHRKVSIVERRLRVGIHNGYCYVQDPLILYLTAEQEDSGMSSLSRKLSFKQTQRRRTVSAESRTSGADERKKLYLRNPIRLDDVPIDDLNAIVFVLEYMLAIPLDPPAHPNAVPESTKMTYTIRWIAWMPGKDKQVALIMSGGEILLSDELFVYKPSKTVQLNTADVVRETLRFDYRFDNEPPTRYPTVTMKSDILTPSLRRSTIPFETEATSAGNYETLQRQRTAPPQTIPSALQPPIYHQANLVPWQADGVYPVYSPMSVLANQMGFAHSLSRAAYARLQGQGFATVKTINGKEAELIDIRQARFLDLQAEMADPMNCNQINLHFLAYFKTTRKGMSSKSTYPKSLFFTFKFYRFPETTTSRVILERMHDNISNDPSMEPYVLWRLKEDSTKTSGLPGLPVMYQIDGSFLGSVEQRYFFEYLNSHTLYIDVWDGDGLFPIGMCALELKYLLRDGRPAIQALVELDVFAAMPVDSSEMPSMENQYYQSSEQQFSLIGEKLKAVGKLVMRIGNVGTVGTDQPSVEKLKATDALRLLPTSRIVTSTPAFDVVQQRMGEISTTGIKEHHLTRAHRLVESYPNLNSVLHTQDKQANETERLRKLSRMEAVRKKVATTVNDDLSTPMATTNRKVRELREQDLRAISMYRQQSKHADIAHHLSNFITKEIHIRLMPGLVEFFEFILQNPYPEQHSVGIACDDDELSVVTDAREWRKLKTSFEVFSETEENMFTAQAAGHTDQTGLKYPQIFMRSKESIHIPFKLQTFLVKTPPTEHQPADNPFALEQTYSVVEKRFNEHLKSKVIKALFQVEDGTPIAILSIHIEYMSPIIDQTIRCINGENTLMKRVIRIPNPRRAITTESLSTGLPEQVHQVFVRSSDLNVVCEVKPVPAGQPCDMLIKVASQNAPTVRNFLVFIYSDGFLHKPINVWQFQIHAVKRLDLTCIQFQTSRSTLLLRGSRSSRLVQCFGNAPEELLISPSNAFSLAANGLHEIHILVRPVRSGIRTFCINAVDVENHQIVDTWMIRIDTRTPIISKQFVHTIALGQSQSVSKRISYTNPYAIRKTFFFTSSHPDLLQLQHQKLEFQANEKKFLSFTLMPAFHVAAITDIIILINNEDDTNEDAYCIRVNYTDSNIPL